MTNTPTINVGNTLGLTMVTSDRGPANFGRKSKEKRATAQHHVLILLAVALVYAGIGSFLTFSTRSLNSTVVPTSIGHIAFASSEQISEQSSQGIMDQVSVDLTNLTNPATGKSYYAWLLGDKKQSDLRTVYLGQLQVAHGHTRLFYPGDATHTNLLLTNSRFLVTEEDSTIPPVAPSPDQHTWRYYGEFAQTPISNGGNMQPFSYLDHLRHLLASDPMLDDMELAGGLNNWMFRNTGKVLEWASSVREQWEENKDPGAVRRQATRTLTYLDGLAFVKQDLAPGTPLLVNERLARMGLVCVNGASQDPPCYVAHIARHLSGLLQAVQPTPEMRKNIADIVSALNNVAYWLTQLRHDAQQVMHMNDQQLQQPDTLTLINDMISNANHAYTGESDPATGEMRQGETWFSQKIQGLAIISIMTVPI